MAVASGSRFLESWDQAVIAARAAGVRSGPFGRALHRAATGIALIGGAVLVALTLLTVISVVGRAAFSAPIPGDFELVEIGMAVAIFAFLPYCQIVRGNVIVDLFTAKASPRTRALLDALGNLLYTAIAVLLTWRVALGGLEVRGYGETTMVLRVPVWWGYLPAVAFLAFLALVCAYTVWRSVLEYRGGVVEAPG
jgi:TRAP-type C4-dicarboxylate transport system permease small subunit